uniref:N-myc-interactor n=1 Tax=Semicossyphus pulcher TaxID=241346 RepID=UPI0037E7B00C
MADMAKNSEVDQVMGPGIQRVPGEEDLELKEAKKELETWKTKSKEAEDDKARLTLEKLDEEDVKRKAQQEMMALSKEEEELKKEFTESLKAIQREIQSLSKHKQDLIHKLKTRQDKLEAKKAESARLKQKFKIYAQIPDSEIEFIDQSDEQVEDNCQPIRGEFVISQRASAPLRGGQALITFEEEKVASQILKMANCSVSCDRVTLNVKPNRISLDPAAKFEVLLQVSRKQLSVYNVPSSLPEERMKDRLEISFSRPSRGGGEVEEVQYDQNTETAQITFLHPGVAHSLALRREYRVGLDSEANVQVGHVYKYELRKFQTFCGSARRTIVLDGIEEVLDPEDLQDYLEIYFQKPSNYGGEIDSFLYAPRGRSDLQVFFTCEEEE